MCLCPLTGITQLSYKTSFSIHTQIWYCSLISSKNITCPHGVCDELSLYFRPCINFLLLSMSPCTSVVNHRIRLGPFKSFLVHVFLGLSNLWDMYTTRLQKYNQERTVERNHGKRNKRTMVQKKRPNPDHS